MIDPSWLCAAAGLLFVVMVLFLTARDRRLNRPGYALVEHLRTIHKRPLVCQFTSVGRLLVLRIGQPEKAAWQRFAILITETQVTIYPQPHEAGEAFTFAPDQLRWFGRPQKYNPIGRNELWMHVERDGYWYLLKVNQYYNETLNVVRALKQIAPELVTPYRRRRPYVHLGVVAARRAEQDLYGAWTLHEPVTLYLMPLYLVVLDNGIVQRKLALETVTQVASVDRLDAEGGVVRFLAAGEALAFAVDEHRQFAEQLAEAAKRSLEQPLEIYERKGKKKKYM